MIIQARLEIGLEIPKGFPVCKDNKKVGEILKYNKETGETEIKIYKNIKLID